MAGGAFEFDLEAPDLRGLLAHVKELDPKLATGLRRELRESGAGIIAEQRELLKRDSTSNVGSRLRITGRSGGKFKVQAGHLRDQISAGLRTRVTAGKSRQSISIASFGPSDGGFNMARVLQKKLIRHPVFGDREAWVQQAGHPYFFEPVRKNTEAMQSRVAQIVDDALTRLAQK